MNYLYLYGELKIKSRTEIKKRKGDETMTVTLSKGTEVELWREEGTDEWYDEHGNRAVILVKKKKRVISRPLYD